MTIQPLSLLLGRGIPLRARPRWPMRVDTPCGVVEIAAARLGGLRHNWGFGSRPKPSPRMDAKSV